MTLKNKELKIILEVLKREKREAKRELIVARKAGGGTVETWWLEKVTDLRNKIGEYLK